MTIRIRPSRRGNFDVTGERLAELGVTYVGYNHGERSYVDLVIPPGVEAALDADPLIEVEWDVVPGPRPAARAWSSPGSGVDLKTVGLRLSELRVRAGLDLPAAAALTGRALSADQIAQIEATGACEAQHLIMLADLYGESLDRIAGRAMAHGDRRQRDR